ncbi:MAG: 3-hydroxyacyl-CoA dehydrogenase [Pseudomonadota bacterium]|jgi:3-hydroxybutyryl-CoA dehydrogenase|nr:3-hydroxyacyl-CoA dehydrogenase [Pseudomonadota bacterium]
MTKSKLNRVTVLGAGVLGGQIAWHSAFKGKAVVVYDPFPEAIAKVRVAHEMYARIYSAELGASDADLEATRSRVTYSDQLEPSVAKADLVIEAVPEVPEIKTRVYQQMAALLPPHTIIATNSSTLLPRDFAEATGRPEKYCALHFANLIWALNLVEIMAHPGTSRETLTAATLFAIEIGQVPIAVQKEQNGYVLNTWFVATLTAAMSLVVNGVSTPEDVDRTYMIANRGCAMGPCGLLDMVGMKTAYDVSSYWGTLNDDAQMLKNAAYVKERFLDKGLQGLMGGEGFYKYPNPAYAAPDFLAVPDSTVVPSLVDRMLLRSD